MEKKKRAAPKKAKAVDSIGEWIMGTVRTSDGQFSRYADPELRALMGRAKEWVMIDATLNSQACSIWPLRLFAAKGRSNTKGITGKRRKHLGDIAAVGKAAMYAEQAGDIVEVTSGPIIELMRKPSPWYRGTDFFKLDFLFRELTGNAFHEVVAEGGSVPTSLLPLWPQFMRVIPDPVNFIRGYWYGRSDAGVKLDVDDVIHRKFAQSPFDPYKGIGPLQAVIAQADLHAASTVSEMAMWENDCTPGLAMRMPEGTTPDQIKQVKSSIQNDHRGVRNKGRVLVTTAAEIVKLSFSPKEMEYLAGRANCAEIIHAAFGIPQSKVKLNDSNLASSLTGDVQYARDTIRPRLAQDAEEWTESILPMFDVEPGEMWFAYDNNVPTDEAAFERRAAVFLANGVWNIDRVRAEIGEEPLEDGAGEEYRINGVPLAQVGIAPASGDQAEAGAGDDVSVPVGSGTDADAGAAVAADPSASMAGTALNGAQIASMVELATALAQGQLPAEAVRLMMQAAFPLIPIETINAIIATLDKFEPPTPDEPKPEPPNIEPPPEEKKSLAALLFDRGHSHKAAPNLTDAENAMMAALRKVFGATLPPLAEAETPEQLRGLFENVNLAASIRSAVSPTITDQFAAGWDKEAVALASRGEMSAFSGYAPALQHLETYEINLANGLSATVRDRLTGALKSGIESGMTMPERAAAVRDAIGGITDHGAETIARTETARAYAKGRNALWSESGLVSEKQWILSGDPCDICLGMQSIGRVPINQPFVQAGATVPGTDYVADYGAIDEEPAHPNCRCYTAAVYAEDKP